MNERSEREVGRRREREVGRRVGVWKEEGVASCNPTSATAESYKLRAMSGVYERAYQGLATQNFTDGSHAAYI